MDDDEDDENDDDDDDDENEDSSPGCTFFSLSLSLFNSLYIFVCLSPSIVYAGLTVWF